MDNLKVMQANSNNSEETLLIDGLSDEAVSETSELIQKFVKSYINKDEQISDEQWLREELKSELPEKSDDEKSDKTLANEESQK